MDAVGEQSELGPHHPLGHALQLVQIEVSVGAVALEQGRQPALAHAARGELRAQVSEHVHRLAGVARE